MLAPKRILILLALSSCVLLTQTSVNTVPGSVSGIKFYKHHSQRDKKKENNPIAKKQEVFVPSAEDLYEDYGRRYDYPDNQLSLYRAHYLDREAIPIRRQLPLSSSFIFRNDEQPIKEYILRRRFGYDDGLLNSRDESNNQLLDAQDYENSERNKDFMIEADQEAIPPTLPFAAAKYWRPFEEPQDTRISSVSPPNPQDMSYAELLQARSNADGYPQRISSQDEPIPWQQEAVDLRAKKEALKAQNYLKHLIEEVGPTVTLKQVLDKYGPKVASLFSELQYVSGARFPNPINETKFTPKPEETKQKKHQKPQEHQGNGSKTGLTTTNHTKINLKTLELASEVTKEAKDFLKIFRWLNKYYKRFKPIAKGDNSAKGDQKDNVRKKKVRIEKITKTRDHGRESKWDYGKIENILNNL